MSFVVHVARISHSKMCDCVLLFVLQDVMLAILGDPKVTSILTKQRGDKKYRLHQGNRLRDMLISLITAEVSEHNCRESNK